MATLRIHEKEALTWVTPSEGLSAEETRNLTPGEMTLQMAVREPGSETEPQLIELRYEPHAQVQPHAHSEDEIVFVLEGELHLGVRVLKAGDSMFIPGRSFYSLKAGAEGLTILNFRPRQDVTFFAKKGARGADFI